MNPKWMTGNEPELSVYKNIRNAAALRASEVCICEGAQSFRRLLSSPHPILSVVVTPEWFDRLKPSASDAIWLAEKGDIERLAGKKLNQGVLAACHRPGNFNLDAMCRGGRFLLLALDRITHTVNLGSIARNCFAFGVNAMLLGKGSVDPYSPRAIQASAGAMFHLPVFEGLQLTETLEQLKSKFQTTIVVADPEAKTSIERISSDGNLCVVFGNEHEGVTRELTNLATMSVRIPIHPGMDSLNVASATAVILFAISNIRGAREPNL